MIWVLIFSLCFSVANSWLFMSSKTVIEGQIFCIAEAERILAPQVLFDEDTGLFNPVEPPRELTISVQKFRDRRSSAPWYWYWYGDASLEELGNQSPHDENNASFPAVPMPVPKFQIILPNPTKGEYHIIETASGNTVKIFKGSLAHLKPSFYTFKAPAENVRISLYSSGWIGSSLVSQTVSDRRGRYSLAGTDSKAFGSVKMWMKLQYSCDEGLPKEQRVDGCIYTTWDYVGTDQLQIRNFTLGQGEFKTKDG